MTAGYPCCSPTTFRITQAVSTNWLMSVRPRIGFAMGRFMPYVTGGLAGTHIKYDESFTDNFANARQNASARRGRAGSILGAEWRREFRITCRRKWNIYIPRSPI